MALEALERYFKYDLEFQLQDSGSIRDFFEGLKGCEILDKLLTHPNFQIYERVSAIKAQYFDVNEESVDFFFSPQYHVNN